MDPLDLAGSVMLVIAAVIATGSVFVHARVRWWASKMGRHLMAYMAVAAALLTLGVVRVFFGDQWWFDLTRTVMYVPVVFVLAQRLWLQVKAQRAERAAAHDLPPAQP